MTEARLRPLPPLPDDVSGPERDARQVALAVRRAGGRALIVGGYVRDRMLFGVSGGEPDLEVFGLPVKRLERALRRLGPIYRVGRAFPVLRVGGLAVEIALPRRESKTGPGHLGFAVTADPFMDFREAARRRDLTLNAIGFDPLDGEILDPWLGAEDLTRRRMRATDADRFPEDPLRALRVAAFASRFGFTADEELEALCARLDLAELSPERIYDEVSKLLLGERPSEGFRFLARTGLLRFLPEVEALVGVPQDPEWHPEGDVFVHTLLALDRASEVAPADPEEHRTLLFAVLCHDFGKAVTTRRHRGRIRSSGHEPAGGPIARRFLERLRAPRRLTDAVEALTRRHLAPALFPRQGAKRGAYRRLARELAAAGTTLEMLLRVSTADRMGRTTADARARRFPAGDAFRARAEELGIFREPPVDAVTGKHVLARDIPPGRAVGRILERARRIGDQSPESDPERILDRALGELKIERRPSS